MKILNLYACLGGNRYKWDEVAKEAGIGQQIVLKMARNLVDYEAGRTILETALGIIKKKDIRQLSIFDELGE